MIVTTEDEKTIAELSLQSGVGEDTIKRVFESLQSFVFLQQAKESNRIHIPFLGNMKIINNGDIVSSGGKEADISVLFSPHAQLKRIIGQLADLDTMADPTDFEVYQMTKKDIKRDFKTKLVDAL